MFFIWFLNLLFRYTLIDVDEYNPWPITRLWYCSTNNSTNSSKTCFTLFHYTTTFGVDEFCCKIKNMIVINFVEFLKFTFIPYWNNEFKWKEKLIAKFIYFQTLIRNILIISVELSSIWLSYFLGKVFEKILN